MLLKDKVVFVTGAASGIGAEGAIAMAREGADVTLADINADGVRSVADRIAAEGGIAHAIALDVGDADQLAAAVETCARRHGRLDVLHSHPGLQIEGTLEQVSVDDMDASWRLNVRSHFVAAKAAMAHMKRARRGSIIITASGSGVQYDSEMIAYATTKHAAVAMTRQIAKDFGKDNVRVNALCPGFIDTPFNRGFEIQMGGRDKLEAYIANEIPMGRFGTVAEMADAIVYLASDRSTFMTGHALVIDGGECL
ncbi:MAG: SDR family NAD(P)-dependent oxidoreductase [Pseudomonadota bacterium]